MMNFSFKGFFYQILIDPILSRLHTDVTRHIETTQRVIDIACGTGSLSLAIARKARHVTGIDLSGEIIETARRAAKTRKVANVSFEIHDATDLSCYHDQEFDVAVTSMAIHQFNADQAVKILIQMKRIASKIIIVDYNYPMPKGFSRFVAYSIEWLAGGDHNRNFRIYMKKSGIQYFTESSGLKIKSMVVRGNGVFLIVVCEQP